MKLTLTLHRVFLGTLIGLVSWTALADQYVSLDSSSVKVENQPGERVILARTAATPTEVWLRLNPRTASLSRCTETRTDQACGRDQGHCGATMHSVCNGRRGCVMIPVVRQCCWDRQICTHYENVPTVQYEEFSIRFEGRALSAETVDEFEVISHDSARSEIQVLKSSDTYRIQFDAEKARFKLRSGHE